MEFGDKNVNKFVGREGWVEEGCGVVYGHELSYRNFSSLDMHAQFSISEWGVNILKLAMVDNYNL